MTIITVKHGRQLLKVLSQQATATPLSVLENRLGLSRRSVFYTIKQVNSQLANHGLEEIENIRGAGYQLPTSTVIKLRKAANTTAHAHNYIELFNDHHSFQSLSQSDRQLLIAFTLVSRTATSLNQLSYYFSVSKTTIIKDLNTLQAKWPHNVSIVNGKSGKSLVGNEPAQRRLVFTNFKRIMKLCANVADFTPNDHYVSQLHLLEKITGNAFTEDSINLLANFIKWTVERLQRRPDCTLGPIKKNNYSLILTWAQSFMGDLQIDSTGEAEFLAEIVNTLAFQHVNRDNPMIKKLRPVTKKMIKRFDDITGADLAHASDHLVNDLTIHMLSTYYRARYRIAYQNPLLPEIKANYRETFEITRNAVQPFESFTSSKLSDDEIALITVYFSGALHSTNLPLQRKDGVMVVCSSGIGTSQLLITQLRSHYPSVNFIGPYNTFQFENADFNHIKLVFSTIDLPRQTHDCQIVTVPVMPGPADWPQIDQQLRLVNLIGATNPRSVSVTTLMDIISNYARIVEPDKLEHALQDYVYRNDHPNTSPATAALDNISAANFYNQPIDWEDAVRFSFHQLVDGGTVTPDYVAQIIQLTKDHGDYMAIGNGVFLAHAAANAGVNRLGFSYNYFTHPFYIDNSQKKLDFVVCVAPVDQEKHIKTLGVLLQCLQNDDWMKQLHNCHSQADLETVLSAGHLF